jgi:hypothetical protein
LQRIAGFLYKAEFMMGGYSPSISENAVGMVSNPCPSASAQDVIALLDKICLD